MIARENKQFWYDDNSQLMIASYPGQLRVCYGIDGPVIDGLRFTYWKWWFSVCPFKMVIFCSHVELPKGNSLLYKIDDNDIITLVN